MLSILQKNCFRRDLQWEQKNILKFFLENCIERVLRKEMKEKFHLSIPASKKLVKLEVCKSLVFGHYACTNPMDREFRNVLSQKEIKFANPIHVAKWLAKCLEESSEFSQVTVAPPGYVNLTLSPKIMYKTMQNIIALENPFACMDSKKISPFKKSQLGNQSKKLPPPKYSILLEFVSANPTGPLNIVSARAAAIGDSLANMLQIIGHSVVREFYVNDYGNQIRLLGLSFVLRYLEKIGYDLRFPVDTQKFSPAREVKEKELKLEIIFPSEGYRGDYLISAIQPMMEKIEKTDMKKELALIVQEVDHSLKQKKGQDGPMKIEGTELVSPEVCDSIGNIVAHYFHRTQRKDLKNFRVSFDSFVFESDMHKKNKILPLLERLKGNIRKSEGKTIFQSSKIGDDDKDRVLMRADGRPTYFLSDLAYHNDKVERKHTHLVDILGPDHHGYVERMRSGLRALKFEGEFVALIAQQVNLLSKEKVVKMSKRAGTIVKLAELQKKIPRDVLRFFFLERSANAPMDFDYEMAKNTTDKNPYYYLAYAHARVCSIVRKVYLEIIAKQPASHCKASEEKTAEEIAKEVIENLSKQEDAKKDAKKHAKEKEIFLNETAERKELFFVVSRYPEELYEATVHLEPHRFLKYLYQMAQYMSQFYVRPENKILEKEGAEQVALIELMIAVRICLHHGLNLLGMDAPEKL